MVENIYAEQMMLIPLSYLAVTAVKYRIAVITEENKNLPKKIPKICKTHGIPCYNVTKLAEKEGRHSE